MIAKCWEKSAGGSAWAKGALVVVNVFMVIFADVFVDSCFASIGIIIVACGEDELRIVALDELSHASFVVVVHAVVTDDGKVDRSLGKVAPQKKQNQSTKMCERHNSP